VELSAPTVRERLQRLVETGVIRRWWMEIDPKALGYPICVYIRVRPMPGQLNKIAALANDLPQVVEAHRVTGEDCFIIKAHIKALENLDELLDRFLFSGRQQRRLFSRRRCCSEGYRFRLVVEHGKSHAKTQRRKGKTDEPQMNADLRR
jgi:DNA-binding Lrp family transcriptional regulator